ncbi:uncharacterized protein LY89DRAFT_787811 [Mollisia scopiformis]|uniref:Uncharacterized protein n=1 Tax=Mollisia scopiformis TaxID=149040 RepID=A0A132BCN3_MOLSC|nr:uncharacterized protein LY89DRAFT_787811 [Mollisia scopiformis]KUJ10190.1 hypothetical protein LY89DRAFT_787811 [Mollisia scopiformis]
MRWLPFVAQYWCVAAIVLAFHALFAGVSNDGLEAAAIITFNTSSLGLSDYYQVNSTFHANITALVPTSVTNPSSITQYLQIQDWYSIHYLSTCSGSFAIDPTTNLLTSMKTNITCTNQKSGYVYTLSDILRKELPSSVASLAAEITQVSYYTAPWIALWYIGLITALIEIVILPMTWAGKRRINGYSFLVTFISYISFQISAALTTGHSLGAYHSSTLPPALYSSEFFAFMWPCMCCMLVVLILVHMEWKFELWTLKGDRITLYRKPPYKSWSLLDSCYDRKPVKTDAGRGEEGWEMQ